MTREAMDWATFWPYYLGEHSNRANRALHITGTTLALAFLIAAPIQGRWWYLLIALLGGYAFAWVGHFFFEKNRPATFKHPLMSFAYDWRMWGLFWTGRLGKELEKRGIEST